MRERDVEKRLTQGVKNLGGLCLKWVSPGNVGVPDRIVLLDGEVIFVELKTEHGRLSPVQVRQLERIAMRGGEVEVLWGMSAVEDFLKRLGNRGNA